MIRLTQTELIHEKKEKDSSSPEDSTPAIKKEAESEPVPAQSTDQAPSGTSDDCINLSKITASIKFVAYGRVQGVEMFDNGCFVKWNVCGHVTDEFW